MLFLKQIMFVMTAVMVVSCSEDGIMLDTPVRLVSPDKVVSLRSDTTFQGIFPEVLQCSCIQIVNDSVIVLQDQASETNPYHFKAYSSDSFGYLGPLISRGRGPGEMISPYIAGNDPKGKYLCLHDNAVGKAYIIDVQQSLESRKASVVHSIDLPPGIADWLPLPGSKQFALKQEKGEFVFQALGSDGDIFCTFHPYRDIDGERCMTHLSSILTNNRVTGKVAEAMVFLPQLNMFDPGTGQMRSVAVDTGYRKWKALLGKMIDKDTREYYAGIDSSPDYIFAAYKGLPLKKIGEPGIGTSIHVFDWDGNFIYDIKVAEDIGDMAFDSRTKSLYCVDVPDCRIVCYRLDALL